MSCPHDAHRPSFSFGNAFRMILPKGSSLLPPKLLALQTAFEQTLAEGLTKLKPKNPSDVLSLCWLGSAMELLSETHNNIITLITALEFPVSKWDEKWMNMYFDDSVKLLDVCNAFTSELSRLDQHQILLRYALHVLASTSGASPSHEQLNRVRSSLHDWTEQNRSRSQKLENCSSILHDLSATLDIVKVKNSAKGKVLIRALYGVKAVTVFICSLITTALLGCQKPTVDLHVSGDYIWAEAFNNLKASVTGMCSLGKVGLKELEAVNARVEKLHSLTIGLAQTEEEQPSMESDSEEVLTSQKTSDPKDKERLKESASDLAKATGCFSHELDLLSKQVEGFFLLVLSGRDTLLSSLRAPHVQLKGNSDKCR